LFSYQASGLYPRKKMKLTKGQEKNQHFFYEIDTNLENLRKYVSYILFKK